MAVESEIANHDELKCISKFLVYYFPATTPKETLVKSVKCLGSHQFRVFCKS